MEDGHREDERKDGRVDTNCEKEVLAGFKSVGDLKKAYDNIRTAFVKKSQEAARLEANTKLHEHGAQPIELSVVDRQSSVEEKKPIWSQENWLDKVTEFTRNNKYAQKYSRQIANEILNDKSLQTRTDALEQAYAKVAMKEFVPQEELAADTEFISKHILSNDQLKKKILSDFVKESKKNIPVLISGGTSTSATTLPEYKTFDDAKKATLKLFGG